MAAKSPGPGYGLAVFDKKGELSRADGATVFPGGIVDVKALGPHLQLGDVDFQVPIHPGALLFSSSWIPHACLTSCLTENGRLGVGYRLVWMGLDKLVVEGFVLRPESSLTAQ